jgi:glucose-1-phosphate thymidylyltransferase
MKGIILAGGAGSRLHPLTFSISKQLLPIYNKPMIYYPLSVLMLAGIKEVLIISTLHDLPNFKTLLGSGEDLGMKFEYAEQPNPDGLAQAFIIGEDFIGDDNVCLILGDNIFYGQNLPNILRKAYSLTNGANIFGYYVHDPERYGVAEIDDNYNVISIEEKPEKPKSNYAIVGLYFYDNNVIEIAKNIKPSNRGELEITSVNQEYLKRKQLKLSALGRGMTWLDTGTHESLLEAGKFVEIIEKRQGLKIACLEEIAYRMNFIDKEQLCICANKYGKSDYGEYLRVISNES